MSINISGRRVRAFGNCLLTATEARRIVAHHHGVFEARGYDCNVETAGQVELAAEADVNWYGLEFASLKRECERGAVPRREARTTPCRREPRVKSKALQNLESQLADLLVRRTSF